MVSIVKCHLASSRGVSSSWAMTALVEGCVGSGGCAVLRCRTPDLRWGIRGITGDYPLAGFSYVELVLVRCICLIHTSLSFFSRKMDQKKVWRRRIVAGIDAHPSGDGRLKVKVALDEAVLTGRIVCVYLDWLFDHKLHADYLLKLIQRHIPVVLKCFYLVIGPDHPYGNVFSLAIEHNWDGDVIECEGASRRKRDPV